MPIKINLTNIWRRLKQYYYRVAGYPAIINWKCKNSATRRALFVYQVDPFNMKRTNGEFYLHHSLQQAIQIAERLDQYGFIVDIYDYREMKIRNHFRYDLIVSHNPDLHLEQSMLYPGTKRVYFASGENPIEANEKVRKRYKDFTRRNGIRLKIKRIAPEGDSFIRQSECIVSFGNTLTTSSFSSYNKQKMFRLNNYGYKNTRFEAAQKDYMSMKKNFLFFSGGDMVAKGLDLLLEVFQQRNDADLYICAPYKKEKDFMKVYNYALSRSNNIHFCGIVQPLSKQYYDIVDRCVFVIHPSATEGQPGGVVQAMHSGLIPVISKHCGLDIENWGILLIDCSLEEIHAAIDICLQKDVDWLMNTTLNVRRRATEIYSEDAFCRSWDTILDSIK
jgi:glycosyltransferase involved in cell wall biosynthesis